MKLLDCFSGAGGAARGYQLAGFHVTGVDIVAQPRYAGDVFIQGDALEYLAAHGHEYDAIHASPPCQAFTALRSIHGKTYKDFIPATRLLLDEIGKPYIIENVAGAPLINCIELCGLMFGLKLFRHRKFESNLLLFQPAHMSHRKSGWKSTGNTGVGKRYDDKTVLTVTGHFGGVAEAQKVMEIDWMGQAGLAQAIPPAYTEYIGRQLLRAVTAGSASAAAA